MSTPKKTSWLSWNVTPEDLHEQVSRYHELSLSKSFRGQVVLFFLFVFAMSLAVSLFLPGIVPLGDVLLGFTLYAFLMYFGYKGRKWALIALLIYWTLDKLATMYASLSVASGSMVMQTFFLCIGIVLIVRALKVEKARKLQSPISEPMAQ